MSTSDAALVLVGGDNIHIVSAEDKRKEIYTLLERGVLVEGALEACWITLGQKLAQFEEAETWRELGYTTFDHFILELRERYHRGRTQLYQYLGVAKKLGPLVPSETLSDIGITKANVLCAIVRVGKQIPPELIEKAQQQSTTLKELRALVGELVNGAPYEKGSWFDFGGCYFTDDEKKAFVEWIKMTMLLLGIRPDTPDHVKRKMIFLAWGQEFAGTHEAEVYGPIREDAPTPEEPV